MVPRQAPPRAAPCHDDAAHARAHGGARTHAPGHAALTPVTPRSRFFSKAFVVLCCGGWFGAARGVAALLVLWVVLFGVGVFGAVRSCWDGVECLAVVGHDVGGVVVEHPDAWFALGAFE